MLFSNFLLFVLVAFSHIMGHVLFLWDVINPYLKWKSQDIRFWHLRQLNSVSSSKFKNKSHIIIGFLVLINNDAKGTAKNRQK